MNSLESMCYKKLGEEILNIPEQIRRDILGASFKTIKRKIKNEVANEVKIYITNIIPYVVPDILEDILFSKTRKDFRKELKDIDPKIIDCCILLAETIAGKIQHITESPPISLLDIYNYESDY